MAKSILGVIVALFIITTSFANASAFASDSCLPLADKKINPDPSVLADHIDESLKNDQSGKGPIHGANINPLEYLEAVNAVPRRYSEPEETGKYSPTVGTVGDLPAYLRTLKSGPMPKGKVSLAGVCEGKLTLRTHEGSGREAHLGEVGWYDQRGDLILAGDCMNTRIPLEITVTRGLPMRSMPEAQAVSVPDLPAFNSPQAGTCPMKTTIVVYQSSAADAPGVRAKLGDDTGGRRVAGAKPGSYDGDGREDYRVSRADGRALTQYPLSTVPHEMNVFIRPSDGTDDTILFAGKVTGKQEVFIPSLFKAGDKVIVRFAERMFSPSRHGIHIWFEEFQACGTNVASAIEAQ